MNKLDAVNCRIYRKSTIHILPILT